MSQSPRPGEVPTAVTQPGTVSPEAGTLQASEDTMPGDPERTLGGDESPSTPGTLSAGDTLGSFVIERELGAGAMGVVLLARDPDLDRSVAIKVLRTAGHSERGKVRLLREAQAVAKIQHPHVVAVHQVGTHEGQVYVVMEFVDGGTLRQWQKAPRRWQDTLEVYRQAAKGLAAAHAVGLVHRDFKPDNVLIGAGGRVRVTDFGIVGVMGEGASGEFTIEDDADVNDASTRLTKTGAIVGTPAYMPPEQYRSGHVDARSDQFAFCVSLYEALFGERPFSGDTVGALLYSVQSGEMRVPALGDLPPEVYAAVDKGLRADPEARHVSMDALLRSLEPSTSKAKWPWVVGGMGAVGLAVGAYALGDTSEAREAARFDCGDAALEIADAWGDQTRIAAEQAFGKHGPVAAQAYTRIAAELDAQASAWTRSFDAACEARRAGTQTDVVYQQRRACLDDVRAEMKTFTALLTEADRVAADGALSSASLLRSATRCDDLEIVQRVAWPTAAEREAQASVRTDAMRARVMLLAGRHAEVVEFATELDARAKGVAAPAVRADILETLARGEMQSTRYEQAEQHARQASTLAVEARDSSLEARATGTLMFVVGPSQGRNAEAMGMLPAGESAAARAEDPRARSYFKAAEAVVRARNGDLDGAKGAADEVIGILEALERPPPDELANAYNNRAGLFASEGNTEAARKDQRRALDVAEAGLGTLHPLYGAYSYAFGLSLSNAGEHEESLGWFRRALAAWEAALGHDHASTALAQGYAGLALVELGKLDQAEAALDDAFSRLDGAAQDDPMTRVFLLHRRADYDFTTAAFERAATRYQSARDIVVKTVGDADARVPGLDMNIGNTWLARGQYVAAKDAYARARVALERIHGPRNQNVAHATVMVADALRRDGRCAEAKSEYANGLRTYNDLELPPDVVLAQLLVGQGTCALERGDTEGGTETIARAAEMVEALPPDEQLRGLVGFAQARAALANGDRDAARSSASTAAGLYDAIGPSHAGFAAEIRDWASAEGL